MYCAVMPSSMLISITLSPQPHTDTPGEYADRSSARAIQLLKNVCGESVRLMPLKGARARAHVAVLR